eukprot:12893570-Prorocentrum_lima.AAC.1
MVVSIGWKMERYASVPWSGGCLEELPGPKCYGCTPRGAPYSLGVAWECRPGQVLWSHTMGSPTHT